MSHGQRGGAADILTLPRLMRGLQHRAETPNADRDPIRYQWHTRPFQHEAAVAPTSNEQPRVAIGRFDSDDILAAVRRRIRSPPDHRIRDAMHRRAVAAANPAEGVRGGGGGQLSSVMAHYLAASSLADSVLNRRLLQPAQQPGCRCCAGVNFANKLRRHRAARGVVPLPEQDRLVGPPSSFYYGASPDEADADHRRLRWKPATPPELRRSEAEHRLEANLRRLEGSIQALGEPLERPSLPPDCSVSAELEPHADEYFRPGIVPTKYLPFAPKNPLRRPPPRLMNTGEGGGERRGRAAAKYVTFSPRNPELVLYSPEASLL